MEWGATGRPAQIVILHESGVSSTPQLLGSIIDVPEYWIARFSRAMTAESVARLDTVIASEAKQSIAGTAK